MAGETEKSGHGDVLLLRTEAVDGMKGTTVDIFGYFYPSGRNQTQAAQRSERRRSAQCLGRQTE